MSWSCLDSPTSPRASSWAPRILIKRDSAWLARVRLRPGLDDLACGHGVAKASGRKAACHCSSRSFLIRHSTISEPGTLEVCRVLLVRFSATAMANNNAHELNAIQTSDTRQNPARTRG